MLAQLVEIVEHVQPAGFVLVPFHGQCTVLIDRIVVRDSHAARPRDSVEADDVHRVGMIQIKCPIGGNLKFKFTHSKSLRTTGARFFLSFELRVPPAICSTHAILIVAEICQLKQGQKNHKVEFSEKQGLPTEVGMSYSFGLKLFIFVNQ